MSSSNSMENNFLKSMNSFNAENLKKNIDFEFKEEPAEIQDFPDMVINTNHSGENRSSEEQNLIDSPVRFNKKPESFPSEEAALFGENLGKTASTKKTRKYQDKDFSKESKSEKNNKPKEENTAIEKRPDTELIALEISTKVEERIKAFFDIGLKDFTERIDNLTESVGLIEKKLNALSDDKPIEKLSNIEDKQVSLNSDIKSQFGENRKLLNEIKENISNISDDVTAKKVENLSDSIEKLTVEQKEQLKTILDAISNQEDKAADIENDPKYTELAEKFSEATIKNEKATNTVAILAKKLTESEKQVEELTKKLNSISSVPNMIPNIPNVPQPGVFPTMPVDTQAFPNGMPQQPVAPQPVIEKPKKRKKFLGIF